MTINHTNKFSEVIIHIFLAVVLVILINLFFVPAPEGYQGLNHFSIHTILELFSIFACFSICSYGWHAYNHSKTIHTLWIPSIFFAVGFLDLLHILTYPGMPHFITEASSEKTIWFWIAARLTATFSLFFLFTFKNRESTVHNRKIFIAVTLFYTFFISFIIFKFEHQLPLLIENESPTLLKNILELFISSILLICIFLASNNYLKTKKSTDLDLLLAFSYLFICEIMITQFTSITDINILIAHIFKAIGYAYIFKFFYFSKLLLSFRQKSEAETNLRVTNGLLESVFLNTPDSIMIIDQNKKIVRVNDCFTSVFNLKKSDVVGVSLKDALPKYIYAFEKMLAEIQNGKTLSDSPIIAQQKDGEKIFIRHSSFPVNREGIGHSHTVIVSRNVTKQVLNEEKIRAVEQEWIELVKRQQGILFKFKEVNSGYLFTLCEGKLLKALGLTPEQVVGKLTTEVFAPEIAEQVKPFNARAWNGEDVSYEIELNNLILFVTYKPLKRNGKVVEVIGSTLDITSLKKAEELLQKSEKLAVVGELAAGLAHEIRNPLTTLKGFTQLLGSSVAPMNQTFINIMLSELDRIESITNEFMVVAKPQAVKYEIYDLKLLIHSISLFAGPQSLLHNVELIVDIKTSTTNVYCDVNQLKQVLINLIKNSFEAMTCGGVLTIELDQLDHTHIVIRIKDTGIGIPAEIIPRLGEPFYTLKEKGTGLGLMVSFRIIEAHKGTIHFDSIENVGTTVEIRLPLPNEEHHKLFA
ncbi:MASE3 domain-containing protein [Litchfieldia salsa]|uniref:histidine kinase n=1 Tax=Litchfieldia salsa TaxID=930152 RepID=A0A1H0U377_9BACI|nr:MASE3 domain-containing protein [Litchfieldia salsa]SDP60408.1 PAS domain S-box-containing protein [Litchfieldia salsa]